MKPLYLPFQAWWPLNASPDSVFDRLYNELEWLTVRDARHEYFMAHEPTTYTYGTPPFDRTYTSKPFHNAVECIERELNEDVDLVNYNVCFLNRYDDEKQQLGWHADDTPGMDMDHPIYVVSLGEPRELWVRPNGASGVVPAEDRYELGHGSLLVMPAGYQRTHQHRIPKGSRKMRCRISLTGRRYVPTVAP